MNILMTLGNVGTAAVAALAASGWALPAQAVNDLPGGPAVNQLDLHPPASKLAADIITLHDFMLIVCLVIFIAVFGVMFYSIFKHRKSKGHQAANFHESVAVEIAWTVVPFLIVIGMGVAATQDGGGAEGHHQRRPHDQGHRLPVEVGLRLHQGRGRRHRLPVDAGPDAPRDVGLRQARAATTTC